MNEPPLVVMVDDSVCMLELMAAQLAKEGYQLRSFRSGVELLSDAQTLAACDAILLDIMMPEINGFETCRRVREGQGRFLPILLVTALDEIMYKVEGLDCGADDFITKPTYAAELRARLRAHLRAKRFHDELQAAHQELMRLSELRDNLVSMIVHDLRNPLGSMGLALQMMGDPPDATVIDSTTWALTRQQVDYALELCRQLLEVRKLEDGELELTLTEASIRATVEAALRPLRLLAQERGISMVSDVPNFSWRTDHNLLCRVLMNIADNAVKHSLGGQEVRIEGGTSGGQVMLSVTDSGPGIAEEDQVRIFELFGRTKSASGRRGTGVGLAFCRLAVRALGGSIGLESAPGKGSRFTVSIPPYPMGNASGPGPR
jgi:signal transduction histidine kinase